MHSKKITGFRYFLLCQEFGKGNSVKMLEKVRGKKIGIYLRKEETNEDLNKGGLGRLKWLQFELEFNQHKYNVYINVYIY